MWFTGIMGTFHTSASALAKLIPTQSAGSSPGPCVTAITSTRGFLSSEFLSKIVSTIPGSRSKIEVRSLILEVGNSLEIRNLDLEIPKPCAKRLF